MDHKTLDELSRRVADAMPSGLKDMQHDLENSLRRALQSTFARMNLVTREEFDVQARVLARSRAKLDALEQRVRELEATLDISPPEDAAGSADAE
jgi:BMFP domain-containing protein YqiC